MRERTRTIGRAAAGSVGVAPLLLASSVLAQSLEISTDTTTILAGTVVERREPALDDGVAVTPTAIGMSAPGVILPAAANLDAFDRFPTGEVVFSTDVTVDLGAGVFARPADVMLIDASGLAAITVPLIPPGADIDALGIGVDAALVSFDTTVDLGSVIAADEDVVRMERVDASTWIATLVYDGSAQGIAPSLDLDAVYLNPSNNHLLLSFDGAGSAGGLFFADEDVLEWDPVAGTYALVYDGSAPPAAWPAGADLDAVSGFAPDSDGDGAPDGADNCENFANPSQSDVGGIGAASGPDGIGDACQCGDVSGNGRVTTADATLITRSLLVPPTAALTRPDLCHVVGAAIACTTADAVVVTRALLVPPTATVQQICDPAVP